LYYFTDTKVELKCHTLRIFTRIFSAQNRQKNTNNQPGTKNNILSLKKAKDSERLHLLEHILPFSLIITAFSGLVG